jgi:SAM-dependent methyltransferase
MIDFEVNPASNQIIADGVYSVASMTKSGASREEDIRLVSLKVRCLIYTIFLGPTCTVCKFAHEQSDSLAPGDSMESSRNRVCPVGLANSLDNRVRRWLHNPQEILAPYVKEGMAVLDIGCGPGFFSIEMAKMVGDNGKVFSADLQEGMLQKLHKKIQETGLGKRIELVKCDKDRINIPKEVDFVFAFFMVHEVPDKNSFFMQLKDILREEGQLLLVEPKLFHVTRKEFELTTRVAEDAGFKIFKGPPVRLGWSALLKKV